MHTDASGVLIAADDVGMKKPGRSERIMQIQSVLLPDIGEEDQLTVNGREQRQRLLAAGGSAKRVWFSRGGGTTCRRHT
jgi:hypothetical protein